MEGKPYMVLILAIAVASEVVSGNGGCETVRTLCPKANGVNATLLPNPDDCGSYCVCDSGQPIYMPCPQGLHFNRALNVCDSPTSADCGSTSTTPNNTSSDAPNENDNCYKVKYSCPKPNEVKATLLPNPGDCESYCVCESGNPIYMPCPKGLHFNAELKVCDWPSSANCDPNESSPDYSWEPTTSDGVTYPPARSTTAKERPTPNENDNCYKVKDSCPKPNEVNATLLPNPGDCESYCVCESGTPIYMPCPKGLHFNAELKVCDWPSSANCDPNESSPDYSWEPTTSDGVTYPPARSTTAKERPTPNENDNCYKVKDSCPKPNEVNATLLPNPGDCESYCVCESGTPIYMPCPKGLHFNAELKVCDWPSSANCDPNESSPDYSWEPTTSDGVTYPPARSTTVKERPTPNENDNCYKVKDSCPKPNEVNATLLPNPGDCESYCVCESGTPVYMPCPKGLYFNAELKVCDWPSSANCDPNESSPDYSWEPTTSDGVTYPPARSTTVKERPTPNENDNCYKVKDSCPKPNEVNATLLPNPGDCESYCVCESGTPVYMPCPKGLYFNAELKVCDWPSSANCDPNESSPDYSWEPTTSDGVTYPPARSTTAKERPTPNENDNCYKVKDSCPKPNEVNATLLPNPGDCESYCVCESGTPIYMPCPKGLHFNAELKVCDWPSSANCDPNESSPDYSWEPTTSDGVTYPPARSTTVKERPTPNENDNCYKVKDSCPKPNEVNATLLPNPGDCKSYCVCESGTPIYMPCPKGLHFNAELTVCDWPSSANCDPNESSPDYSWEPTTSDGVTYPPARSTTAKERPTPNENDNCYKVKDSCPKPNEVNATLLPNPGDCESYCVCESGTPIYMPCPKGLHFNAELKVCDWPSSANCDPNESSPDYSWEPTTSDGVTYPPARSTTVKERPTPNENDNCYKVKDSCPKPNEVNATLLPNPGDCKSYCVCESGNPIYMPCPKGLHFNAELKVCDWPSSANCDPNESSPDYSWEPTTSDGVTYPPARSTTAKERPTPNENDNCYKVKDSCPKPNEVNATLLPNPGDCESYCVCESGTPIYMPCPKGLHFNSALNVCVLPSSANCGQPLSRQKFPILSKPLPIIHPRRRLTSRQQ